MVAITYNGYLYGVRCAMIKITNFKITDTLEKLLSHPKIQSYISWIKKQK